MDSVSQPTPISVTSQPLTGAGPNIPLREIVTDALRYWEPRRILYNAVLAAIVIYYYYPVLNLAHTPLPADFYMSLVILAVLANMCYCAAYIVDIFVQLSNFRTGWRSRRWVLFVLGLVVAGILTQLVAEGMFT